MKLTPVLLFKAIGVSVLLAGNISPLVIAAPAVAGGVTATYQSSDDNGIENEFTISADLVLTWQLGGGEIYTYFEGNSTPKTNGISSNIPEANADAGSALDEDRKGRIQISELGYRYAFDEQQTLTTGLLDVSGFFDQSRIASDENSQFLGVSFVQNPTIEFPDYTIGVVYENALSSETVVRAAITSSNGIADNPNLSYSQLVEVNSDDKGVFSIVSITRKMDKWLFRAGAWVNTASHQTHDGIDTNENNYGSYLLSGYQSGHHGINFRYGISNGEVSSAEEFAGISYQFKYAPWVFGAGIAKIFLSDHVLEPLKSDTTQSESYLRYKMNENMFVTFDIQRLQDSNFNELAGIIDSQQTLYGLRLTYVH